MTYTDIRNFTLKEDVQHDGRPNSKLSGKIELRSSSTSEDRDLKIELEMQSTSLTFLQRLSLDQMRDGMTLGSDRPSPDGCTIINLVVYVKPGLAFDRVVVHARHLAVELTKGLALTVSETYVSTDHEPIADSEAQNFIPDQFSVKTLTGRIFGAFPISNLLSLTTESGSIDIRTPVLPLTNIDAATLQARSVSSSIVVNGDTALQSLKPPANFSNVDRRTDLRSVSGQISIGNIPQGSSTFLETVAGSIDATLLPSGCWGSDLHFQSNITTRAPFGQTIFTLAPLSPQEESVETHETRDTSMHHEPKMRNVRSSHSTQFGNLHLRYPSAWEGVIRGITLSGSLDAAGEGLDVVEHAGLGRRIKAVKGDQSGSLLTLETLSGNAEILVG